MFFFQFGSFGFKAKILKIFFYYSEQSELMRISRSPAMAPVLQNPKFLQVDPDYDCYLFSILNEVNALPLLIRSSFQELTLLVMK